MLKIGSLNDAGVLEESGQLPCGGTITLLHLILSPDGASDSPNAFLVRQSPGSELPAHFHFSREFQIAVEGSGMLGRHRLAPITVHYAAGQTGYGPIIAGDEGLGYLTLRQVLEARAHFLPASGHLMTKGQRRRQKTTGVYPQLGARSEAPEVTELLSQDATGMAAWLVKIPPYGTMASPPGEGQADRYRVIINGALRTPTGEYSGLSVIWYPADAAPSQMEAGAAGVDVLIAQFPRPGLQG